MSWVAQLTSEKILLFVLVLSRLSALLMTAPNYGMGQVPVQVRALISFALTLVILPTQWHVHVEDPGNLVNYAVLVGGELLIGASLGIAVQILFSGVQTAGQVIGQMSGEMLASAFDPSIQEDSAVLSQFLYWVALAVFLTTGAHRLVMAGLLDTYQTIPPGAGTMSAGIATAMVALLTASFHLAIQAAAPIIAALLMTTLVVGLVARTLPQLNIMALGFGLNSTVMLAVTLLSLGGAAWAFQGQVETALASILAALHGT